MTIKAIRSDYHGEFKDSQEKFGGNIIVYIGWDYHLLFCATRAFPLPPQMSFSDVINGVIPEAYSAHPEFDQINWDTAEWLLNGEPISPGTDDTLESLGVDHKSVLRFATPELTGYAGAHI